MQTFRQLLDVAHAVTEALSLARAELGARLQHPVFAFQFARQHVGEGAAAGADLDEALEAAQLPGKGAAEEAAELGCGDEVARRAELARAARVIADPRFVQRELHVARERKPAAGGGDLLDDAGSRRHAENLP